MEIWKCKFTLEEYEEMKNKRNNFEINDEDWIHYCDLFLEYFLNKFKDILDRLKNM